MAPVTSAAGMPINVGDIVRYIDSNASSFPGAVCVGIVTSINQGANTFNATYLKTGGTTGTSTGIVATTAHQLVATGGPANAECVAMP
jgi:hypothetical protein